MSFASMHNDYLDPDRTGLNDEISDNSAVKEAFADYDSPYDLYRSTYKYTDCGPGLGVTVQYVEGEDNGESGPGGTYEREVVKTFYCDDLRNLGTWKDMDDKGMLVLSFLISSIVEGVDQCTDTIVVEHKPFDEEPSELAARYWKAVEDTDKAATYIWNETHGCETCAKHFGNCGEWGECEGGDGMTPVWNECPDCGGSGSIL